MDNLNGIFAPESVAVIGASATPGKVGHDIFQNILKGGYTGTLYPVNPIAKSILCVKAYSGILDIEDNVDLAMIILPPIATLKVVEECIKKNVKGIVIVSAGFVKSGKKDLKLRRELQISEIYKLILWYSNYLIFKLKKLTNNQYFPVV